MRDAGRVVRAVLDTLVAAAVPGVSTSELDRIAESRTRELGGVPSFKGYLGYPASVCISVNEEVVHGIPSEKRLLSDGDVVGLDFGAVVGGFHGDAAETVLVGRGSPEAERLVAATRAALAAGVAAARAGGRVGDIGAAVQRSAESAGFSVVREFVGHGIGRKLHEPPQVPNFGRARHRGLAASRTGPGHRADAQRRPPRNPDPRGRLDRRHRGREAFPRTSSTPWPSPRRVRRYSPGRGHDPRSAFTVCGACIPEIRML